ncbi:Protein mpe1 [Friedmanniomyces endolithicus]|nr:Protein mpe1 [Friedmanniomyces endolithicus]
MSSSIFFRFKSQKDPLQMTFDGTSLSVFEVKREIIAISKLGDGTDFDLEIYTPESMEKYDDDTTQIPRSTTVIARRLPASKQGAGRAARYVTGKMPIMAKNQHRVESSHHASSKSTPIASAVASNGREMTEEEKLNAMFTANNEAWKQDQAQMAGRPVIGSSYNKQQPVPDKPLPPGYTCHRCGEKACPTNNDPTFDGRPKFRRTTGIPRSMLKVIDKPTELGEDGKIDVSKLPPGVMYTATGEWVIAEPDKVAWEKFQEKQKASTENAKGTAQDDKELLDRGLQCPIDKLAFVHPVKTPCCGTTYCHDCIEHAVLDNDLLCPNCGEQVLIDDLAPDDEAMKKLAEYEAEKKATKLQKDMEASKSPAPGTPSAEASKSDVPEIKINGTGSAASTPNSRKRTATDELENNRKPTGPTAMKNDGSKQGTPIPTGPKVITAQQPPVQIAGNMQDFVKQMTSLASTQGMPQNGMTAMMNPMMGMPMGPGGMGMPMMGPMMGMPGMGMPGMPGMPGIGGFGMNGMPNMGNMVNMNGMGNMGNMGMYGGGMMQGGGMPNGGGGWGNPQQGWGGGNGMQGGGGNNGAYMRQPVNPQRHQQGRQRRQRSVDYKQMGSG